MKSVNIAMLGALIVSFTHSAMADQLVVKESKYRLGYSASITVEDKSACIRGARAISNLKRHSQVSLINRGEFFAIEFYCITKEGRITSHGTMYQLPFSPQGDLCMYLSGFNGYNFDNKRCNKQKFQ